MFLDRPCLSFGSLKLTAYLLRIHRRGLVRAILDLLGEAFWEFIGYVIAEAFRKDRPSFPKDVL